MKIEVDVNFNIGFSAEAMAFLSQLRIQPGTVPAPAPVIVTAPVNEAAPAPEPEPKKSGSKKSGTTKKKSAEPAPAVSPEPAIETAMPEPVPETAAAPAEVKPAAKPEPTTAAEIFDLGTALLKAAQDSGDAAKESAVMMKLLQALEPFKVNVVTDLKDEQAGEFYRIFSASMLQDAETADLFKGVMA